ncbi:MAG: lactate utilization protein [Pseudomonadota bacterium]
MTSARDTVLGSIRKSLKTAPGDALRAGAVDRRLADAEPGLIPTRGQKPPAEQVNLFIEMIEAVNATTERIADAKEIPTRIAAFLRAHNLPQAIAHGADTRLDGLDWTSEPQLERKTGATSGDDLVGMSHALGGAAETGTLVLTSGPDNPTTLNFLPETHIVVVAAEDICGDYETLWARIRAHYGKGEMPRTVNWVTGPSRSADIEQTLLLGAHGPRRLHVIISG